MLPVQRRLVSDFEICKYHVMGGIEVWRNSHRKWKRSRKLRSGGQIRSGVQMFGPKMGRFDSRIDRLNGVQN